MLNVGVGEMILILLVVLIVFGPNRLPEIARSMGKFLHNFQQETNRALNDLKQGLEPTTTGVFDKPDPETTSEPVAEATTRTLRVTKPGPRRKAPASKRVSAAKKPGPVKKKTPAKKRAGNR